MTYMHSPSKTNSQLPTSSNAAPAWQNGRGAQDGGTAATSRSDTVRILEEWPTRV